MVVSVAFNELCHLNINIHHFGGLHAKPTDADVSDEKCFLLFDFDFYYETSRK